MAAQDLWVFGYGSLMWRPGFPYVEALHAVLSGAHRALCVYSFIHRGTPERPGLVLGLDVGGRCEGIAFRVPPDAVRATLAYLRRREQVTHVYRQVHRPVRLLGEGRRSIEALCFLADRSHSQYAGQLPLEMQLRLVRQARGRSGRNAEYVLNTLAHLRELGIADRQLERLAAKLGGGWNFA